MIWLGEDEESSGLHRLITTASTVLYHYCYSYFCDEVRLGFFLRSPWKNPANLLLFFVTSDQKRVTVWSPVFGFPGHLDSVKEDEVKGNQLRPRQRIKINLRISFFLLEHMTNAAEKDIMVDERPFSDPQKPSESFQG